MSVGAGGVQPDAHAPIGVMRDHTHAVGEWMLSWRYMYMDMQGSRMGTRELSAEEIVTLPNRFADAPMQPPVLRVVPTRMQMQMYMFGAMYAISDRLTLLAMGNWQLRDMDHQVYQGGAGLTPLGTFNVRTRGFGDTRLSGLYALPARHGWVHLNMGLRLPAGSVSKSAKVLAQNGMRPTLRVPCAMQPGTGTVALLPGVHYSDRRDRIGWGLQYAAELRLGEHQGYSVGDEHGWTAWGSYRLHPQASASLRLPAPAGSRAGQDTWSGCAHRCPRANG